MFSRVPEHTNVKRAHRAMEVFKPVVTNCVMCKRPYTPILRVRHRGDVLLFDALPLLFVCRTSHSSLAPQSNHVSITHYQNSGLSFCVLKNHYLLFFVLSRSLSCVQSLFCSCSALSRSLDLSTFICRSLFSSRLTHFLPSVL